jgi:hypothetical protein
MAHHTLQAGAPNLPLGPGIKLVLEAVNPSTDAAVAGVVVTRWTIYGDDESPGLPLDEGPIESFLIPTSG